MLPNINTKGIYKKEGKATASELSVVSSEKEASQIQITSAY
jgi:hypothetical protein